MSQIKSKYRDKETLSYLIYDTKEDSLFGYRTNFGYKDLETNEHWLSEFTPKQVEGLLERFGLDKSNYEKA